mmetsp:Transcript_14023/g.24830  ORF Transcript_14023/g.24830 Transcript_14023/m.24830 type:complete len:394 (-) Transcript_14023:361-1542(-)
MVDGETFMKRLAAVDMSEVGIVSLSGDALALPNSSTKVFVKAWYNALEEDPSRGLVYLYVANDIVQKAKKSKSNILEEFRKILPRALGLLTDPAIKPKVLRVLSLWADRGVYSSDTVKSLKQKIGKHTINPLFGSLSPEPDYDNDAGSISEDNDDDDDDNDDDQLLAATGRPPLRRGDSTGSITEVALPRLILATKKVGFDVETEYKEVKQELETHLSELDVASKNKGVGSKDFQDHLDSLGDYELTRLNDVLRLILKKSAKLSEDLGMAHSMETSLISSLEVKLENLTDACEDYDQIVEKSVKLKNTLSKLKECHPESKGLETTKKVKKRVRKESTVKPDREEELHSSSEEDEDEEEDEGDDAGPQDEKKTAGVGSLFGPKKTTPKEEEEEG